MNYNGALFLFIILILGLLLCSFLGGTCNKEGMTSSTNSNGVVTLNTGISTASTTTSTNASTSPSASNSLWNPFSYAYDNYNHYSGSSYPTTFYGPNGGTAQINNAAGVYSIVVTNSDGTTTAYVVNTNNNNTPDASNNSPTDASSNNISQFFASFSNNTFYGPNGGYAKVFNSSNGQYAIEVTQTNGTTIIYTNTNTYTYNDASNNNTNAQPVNTPYTYYSYPYNSAPSQPVNQNYNSQYYSTLPPGIPRSLIPPGQEDLYILKSEIVPPVCPACPACTLSTTEPQKCPPCPACARCPEPSFECKKVPNYNSGAYNGNNLPVPVVNSFSTFGM